MELKRSRESGAVGAVFDQFHGDYDEALAQGLSVSGEDRLYFARGRIALLAERLTEIGGGCETVLDFGCGTGASTPFLLDVLGAQAVLGVDVSVRSIEFAQKKYGSARVRFVDLTHFEPRAQFSVAFCNGVFHHVPVPERAPVARLLFDAVKPGGYFSLWDNNPWNPGARYVMSRIPFDRDAVMLSSREAARLLKTAGFTRVRTDYNFVFPRALRALRFLEPLLHSVPVGAQYQVLGRRPFWPAGNNHRRSAF